MAPSSSALGGPTLQLKLSGALAQYPAQDTSAAGSFRNQWGQVTATANMSNRRWSPGSEILREIARQLRRSGRGEPWVDLWHRSVDSLHALGEAVRVARNRTAYGGDADFRRSDVGLLLGSMPMSLEHAFELRVFLGSLPSGLTLPTI